MMRVEKETTVESFRRASELWMERVQPRLKESSIVKYRNIINIHLLPYFREMNMTDITSADVLAFCNTLIRPEEKGALRRSPKTAVDILTVLKAIYKFASREGGFECAVRDWPSVGQFQRPLRVLSLSEQHRLSSYLLEHLTLCNLGILLCLYTGMRIGEICALKWEDISFEESTIQIRRTMQRIQRRDAEGKKTVLLISSPKSSCSIRSIPLPDEIFSLIVERRESDASFFLTGKENRYMEPRTMQNRFKTIIRKCGISDANFHSLRHTFATRCVELGFDIKSLSEILGHSNVNITLNRYVHPSMEQKRKNMNLLSVYLSSDHKMGKNVIGENS